MTLTTAEDAINFERMLDVYGKARTNDAYMAAPLSKAFTALASHPAKPRILAALQDVAMNQLILLADQLLSWAPYLPFGLRAPEGALGVSELDFVARMDAHRFTSACVLRHRALWDKLMGTFVLLWAPSQYDRFHGSKSRKKEFQKIMEPVLGAAPNSLKPMLDGIQSFDDLFRTAEAHGTGSLRKTAFADVPHEENPKVRLVGYENALGLMLLGLYAIFDIEGVRKGTSSDMHAELEAIHQQGRTMMEHAK